MRTMATEGQTEKMTNTKKTKITFLILKAKKLMRWHSRRPEHGYQRETSRKKRNRF